MSTVQNEHDDNEGVNEKLMAIEAEAAVREVSFAVTSVSISTQQPMTPSLAYLNLETREGERLCVELTPRGFRIVGQAFDHITTNPADGKFYETIYSLLDDISPKYRLSFGEALTSKLNILKNSTEEGSSKGLEMDCEDSTVLPSNKRS